MARRSSSSPNLQQCVNISVPMNFIPGTTTPVLQPSPQNERKYKTNLCFQGIKVILDAESSLNQRAILSAGLKAITIPAPSAHTECNNIHEESSSPLHLFQINRSNRYRSNTQYETKHIYSKQRSNTNKNDLHLPQKIVRNQLGTKKWKSLENMNRIKKENDEIDFMLF